MNKLGEPDTLIKVLVTAEDSVTQKEYQVTIKRPYGTIKGSIKTFYKEKHVATIRIYNSETVANVVDLKSIQEGFVDDLHTQLLALNSIDIDTNYDGTYEIYVVPGKYDIMIDKIGYLDHIYANREVQKDSVLDFGEKKLVGGDVNKDGCIQIQDAGEMKKAYGIVSEDEEYELRFDLNGDGQIQIQDIGELKANYSETRKIEFDI